MVSSRMVSRSRARVIERLRQPLHGGTKLLFGLLASGRQPFGVSFAPRLIQFAGRFALRIRCGCFAAGRSPDATLRHNIGVAAEA